MIYQDEWPDFESSYMTIKQLVLNYNDTVSNINFYPSELADYPNGLRSVSLINLLEILDFKEYDYVNVTHIKSYVRNLFQESSDQMNSSTKTKRHQVYQWIKASFCKAYIKFLNHRIKVDEQKPQFQFTGLLASNGGTLDLWIGWSALTLVEFVSLAARYCGWTNRYNARRQQVKPMS